MKQNARDVARHVLRRVRRDEAYANLALSAALSGRGAHLSAVDKALATELVYGVLRHRSLLDHALSLHCRRPLRRVSPDVLDALRLAAYQILLLDRIPGYAAVNDAVDAVRRDRGKAPAGFANAVLRKLAPPDLEQGLPPPGSRERWALRFSLPLWLARRWEEELGREEARELARQLLRRAGITGRVNALRGSVEELARRLEGEGGRVQPCSMAPSAFHLRGLPAPFAAASFLDGLWTAQDEAAQLVSYLANPQPGETVLDACCGVGGKSTHLAALMQNSGRVVCVDRSARKLELLREHCLRLGVEICGARQADLMQAGVLDGLRADRVLLDAPCSGLGVLGRHPELKWRLQPDVIPPMVKLQRGLLDKVIEALRPGGTLVYSVCTTTEEEGPEQARWLLQTHGELRPHPAEDGPMAGLTRDGAARLWPHQHRCDGFYMARFLKL